MRTTIKKVFENSLHKNKTSLKKNHLFFHRGSKAVPLFWSYPDLPAQISSVLLSREFVHFPELFVLKIPADVEQTLFQELSVRSGLV